MAHVPGDLKTTDDRMRSVDEAVKQLAASLTAIADVETVRLARADGRVLVQDLVAPIERKRRLDPTFKGAGEWGTV